MAMTDRSEEHDFHPIGSLLPKIETLPARSSSTPTQPPQNSVTTGAPFLAARGSSSIGQLRTATDADRSPSEDRAAPPYNALAPRRELSGHLRMRSARRRETLT